MPGVPGWTTCSLPGAQYASSARCLNSTWRDTRHSGQLEPPPPEGFALRQIDAELASRHPAYLPLVDPVTGRFGTCLLDGEQVVSQCSAVFVGAGEAEIDIYTQEDYQGRGFARLTANAFIDECLRRGLRPNWACWPEREASIALARRLGFEERPDVPAHLWFEGI